MTSAGGQRVAGARAHGLVGGMADVRRVLDHAAAGAREHRRDGLGRAGCRASGTRRPRDGRSRCCRCRRPRWPGRRAAPPAGTAACRRARRTMPAWATAAPAPVTRAPASARAARRPRRRRAARGPRRSRRPQVQPRRRPAIPMASARRRPGPPARSPAKRIRPAGRAKTLSAGRNAIRSTATPAIEPSRAARGTTRRAQSPPKASTSLTSAHRHRDAHADLPGEHRIAGREHHGSQHAEHDPEQRRRVDAERHRRHVGAPLARASGGWRATCTAGRPRARPSAVPGTIR